MDFYKRFLRAIRGESDEQVASIDDLDTYFQEFLTSLSDLNIISEEACLSVKESIEESFRKHRSATGSSQKIASDISSTIEQPHKPESSSNTKKKKKGSKTKAEKKDLVLPEPDRRDQLSQAFDEVLSTFYELYRNQQECLKDKFDKDSSISSSSNQIDSKGHKSSKDKDKSTKQSNHDTNHRNTSIAYHMAISHIYNSLNKHGSVHGELLSSLPALSYDREISMKMNIEADDSLEEGKNVNNQSIYR